MKYASIIIGVIILLVIVGLFFAFVPRYGGLATVPGNVVTYGYGTAPAYQASVLGTTQVANNVPMATIPVTATTQVVNAGYPYPNNSYGTVPSVPVVPVVWYTSPNQPTAYLYGNTSQTVVYPQQSQTQVYTYSNPGVSNGTYQYQYANTQNQGVWYQ